jgi:hypothetical protein
MPNRSLSTRNAAEKRPRNMLAPLMDPVNELGNANVAFTRRCNSN